MLTGIHGRGQARKPLREVIDEQGQLLHLCLQPLLVRLLQDGSFIVLTGDASREALHFVQELLVLDLGRLMLRRRRGAAYAIRPGQSQLLDGAGLEVV